MLFSNQSISEKPIIQINNESIQYVSKSKNLGIMFNENFDWETHINGICSKVFFALASLSSVSSYIPLPLRRRLVISLIVPLLTYGDSIFSYANANCLRKLDICFNACLRYIYKRKKFDHLTDIRNTILGCDLTTHYKYRMLVQLFVILKNKQPEYLYNSIQFARSSRTQNLNYPIARSNHMLNSFAVRSAQLWNALPNWIKLASTITEFKRLLKSHMKIEDV